MLLKTKRDLSAAELGLLIQPHLHNSTCPQSNPKVVEPHANRNTDQANKNLNVGSYHCRTVLLNPCATTQKWVAV